VITSPEEVFLAIAICAQQEPFFRDKGQAEKNICPTQHLPFQKFLGALREQRLQVVRAPIIKRADRAGRMLPCSGIYGREVAYFAST